MARETWEVDDFVLTDGTVIDVEYRDGLNTTPSARADSRAVAGRHGELAGSRLKFGPGSFMLHLWLAGTTKSDLETRWENVQRAMNQVHRLHTFVRGLADGTERTCRGRLAQGLQPVHLGQLAMRVDAEVNVPAAFWTDVASTTDQTAAGAALPKDLVLNSKARATAPMGDLVYTIPGPATNPKVAVTSDPEVADWFTYAGTIPNGQGMVVDAGAWTVTGTGGFVPNMTLFSWTGDRFLEVPPGAPGVTPAVRLSGTAGGAATQLLVAGRASYLC